MKLTVFLAITAALAAGAQELPGQPYASYWFPGELLSWTPAGDTDAPYNRGTIPLASRSYGDTQCNAHARADLGGVAALSIMYPTTSFNPSQGGPGIDVYAFNYWQYLDHLTFWGGSAGEGLILAPNPGVIDAGHRNGVPVYGTIFLPPVAYGGQIQWVWDLVQKSGSTFPVADKLIEMTEYYGFDGWFINQETAGGNAQLAQDMRDFMIYIQQNSDLEIQWYDAMTEAGGINWQNALNGNNDWFFQHEGELVSQHMFLNFWWSTPGLANSAAHALSLGRSPYELYAGVDVQANGYNTGVNWAGIFPEGADHVTSVGFYCPNWTYSNASSHGAFYTRANRFWSGANRDPSNTETSHPWKGLAHYYAARTPVTSFPFITNFNTGQGYMYSIEGETLSEEPWNNLGQQDVLPTWRWMAHGSANPLYPEMDWEYSYYGGNCLKVSGDPGPGGETMLYLFKTDALIASSDSLVLVWFAGNPGDPSGMEAAMSLSSNPELFHYVEVPPAETAGWNTFTFSLGGFAGSKMAVAGIFFTSPVSIPDYTARIGRMGVTRAGVDVPAPPSGLFVEQFSQVDDVTGTIRLRWQHSPSDVYTYNVYKLNEDDSRTFLWAATGEACFVPRVTRDLSQQQTTILVEAVSPEFGFSSPVSATISWETTGIEETGGTGFYLNDPSANPARGTVSIGFGLPNTGPASLRVYDLSGRVVQRLLEAELQAGEHQLNWNTGSVPAGVYLYRLESNAGHITRKCMVVP
jgi:endo-beta-N-acetylglucosaminidase D